MTLKRIGNFWIVSYVPFSRNDACDPANFSHVLWLFMQNLPPCVIAAIFLVNIVVIAVVIVVAAADVAYVFIMWDDAYHRTLIHFDQIFLAHRLRVHLMRLLCLGNMFSIITLDNLHIINPESAIGDGLENDRTNVLTFNYGAHVSVKFSLFNAYRGSQ